VESRSRPSPQPHKWQGRANPANPRERARGAGLARRMTEPDRRRGGADSAASRNATGDGRRLAGPEPMVCGCGDGLRCFRGNEGSWEERGRPKARILRRWSIRGKSLRARKPERTNSLIATGQGEAGRPDCRPRGVPRRQASLAAEPRGGVPLAGGTRSGGAT